MTIKQTLSNKIREDVSLIGLTDCCEAIAGYIAEQDYPGDFYLSLSDILSASADFEISLVERAVNYFCSDRFEDRILMRSYCFLDDNEVMHELEGESVEALLVRQTLYHPDTGRRVDNPLERVFVLYKTNVGKVSE